MRLLRSRQTLETLKSQSDPTSAFMDIKNKEYAVLMVLYFSFLKLINSNQERGLSLKNS